MHWVCCIILALLIIAALITGIIAAIRVSFTKDSNACGGSANSCELPYKDYLGNCVAGRTAPNGAACTDTCFVGGTGTCQAGTCQGACPGTCTFVILSENATQHNNVVIIPCPDLIVQSPLFGAYPASKWCELGGVCTYEFEHDDNTFEPQLWVNGDMGMLKDKCWDLVANSSFTSRDCMTADVRYRPSPQQLIGSNITLDPQQPPMNEAYVNPTCVMTFRCSRHVYQAGEFLISNTGARHSVRGRP